MGLVLLATLCGISAFAVAYFDELMSLVRVGPAGDLAAPPPPREAPRADGSPTSMLASLVKDLVSADPRRRTRALERLPQFPPRELTGALVPLLAGPPDETRDRIADLLLRHGGEDVLDPLHRYFLGREEAFEMAASQDPTQPVRLEPRPDAARKAPEGPGRLIPFDLHRRARTRRKPQPEVAGAPAFPPEVLSPEPALRARAMADLPESGHPQAGELLAAVLRGDPDPLVRAAAAAALGRAPAGDEGLDVLAEAAQDDLDGSVRWNACYALGKRGDRRAKGALRRAENDPDGSVRLAARKALETLGLDPPLPAQGE